MPAQWRYIQWTTPAEPLTPDDLNAQLAGILYSCPATLMRPMSPLTRQQSPTIERLLRPPLPMRSKERFCEWKDLATRSISWDEARAEFAKRYPDPLQVIEGEGVQKWASRGG